MNEGRRPDPEGVQQASPGRSPGLNTSAPFQALKGRNSRRPRPVPGCVALSGRAPDRRPIPRAAPCAFLFGPFGAGQCNAAHSHHPGGRSAARRRWQGRSARVACGVRKPDTERGSIERLDRGEGAIPQEHQHVLGSQPVAPELFGGTALGVSRASATRPLQYMAMASTRRGVGTPGGMRRSFAGRPRTGR